MRHLATYMLLVLGGNASPTVDDITQALSQVGVEVLGKRMHLLALTTRAGG
jgi:ribosomal protein L12E/L44/L45/RPP1/RPP2